MPSARSSSSVATSAAQRGRQARTPQPVRPRRVPRTIAVSRIAWDRKFRTVMLVVLALVGYIGVKGMISLMSARAQADQQRAIVQTLARENRALEQQQRSLSLPATIIREARMLGMVRAGERAYAVTGLPGQ
jgi:cell division protein FtsB